MTVVIETGFTGDVYPMTHPRVGWRRMSGTVTASSSVDGFNAANAGTPRTDTAWRPTGVPNHIWTLTPASATVISYVGIAAHDLGTQNATVSLQINTGAGFVTVAGTSVSPADDDPVLWLIDPVSVTAARVVITATDAPPTIAVIAMGEVTEYPRLATWTGQPITEGDDIRFTNNMSDTGNWLGRTKVSDGLTFSLDVDNLSETWRQTEFKEFKAHANGEVATFFAAHRPFDYPNEVAYAWLEETARMDRALPNKRVSGSISLRCRGYRK